MGMDMYKQPRQHEARLRILKWMRETGAAGTADFSNLQSKLWKHLTTIRMSLELIKNTTESHSTMNKAESLQNPATNSETATLFTGIKHKGENLNLWCNINPKV